MADESSQKPPVGVIGLGIIGSRVSARLRQAGYPVYVYNRSPKAEPNFLGSVEEVTETARVLQVFVRNSDDLLEVVGKMVVGGVSSNHLIINCATVSPDSVEKAEAIITNAGARFINAPFMGTLEAAQNGALMYYVGGAEADLERAEPVLAVSSAERIPAGTPRAAAVIKLCSNLMVAIFMQGLGEAMGLSAAAGVSGGDFYGALGRTGFGQGLVGMKAPRILEDDFAPHFTINNLYKDVTLALELAETTGRRLPALEVVSAQLRAAMEAGYGEEDFAALAKVCG
jgi:3-hydroxyisobutyrate dehydrogenase-like beta-hydroxyacid dehydrogenase